MNGKLVFVSENMRTHYFFASTLGSTAAVSGLLNLTIASLVYMGTALIAKLY